MTSILTGETLEVSLNGNQTTALIGPEDGLHPNLKYAYGITATNSIGNVTSNTDGTNLCKYR